MRRRTAAEPQRRTDARVPRGFRIPGGPVLGEPNSGKNGYYQFSFYTLNMIVSNLELLFRVASPSHSQTPPGGRLPESRQSPSVPMESRQIVRCPKPARPSCININPGRYFNLSDGTNWVVRLNPFTGRADFQSTLGKSGKFCSRRSLYAQSHPFVPVPTGPGRPPGLAGTNSVPCTARFPRPER